MPLISTILSILGLFAVSVSLAYQSHQAKIAQMIGSRERHVELTQLMMQYPHLNFEKMDDAEGHNQGYRIGMSLWMAHWNMLWHIKKMDEKALRSVAADLFQRRPARDWWMVVGQAWSSKNSRRERRFIAIVTSECVRASTANPIFAAPIDEENSPISAPTETTPAPAVSSADRVAPARPVSRVDARRRTRRKRRPARGR
ncbi:hypothetical protein Q0Z83_010070 [Actinoplanes sichuanensis]|uniref:DUF6082 family protein n=1 Tax=Actinoplanes sichuanensis TaxID=512349 RepID=A0ABW4A5M7_9ACTN|nr:DUF6082 family protein [Actinoplanes sichuanensis]BEL02816.1 hypothetical protein Q0Z83_010070 [Actinoplanes sichuanensis]